MAALAVFSLFDIPCPCGLAPQVKAGLCSSCYQRQWRDRTYFGGHRAEVIERDGSICQVCQNRHNLIVHHRTYEDDPQKLISLCRACHPKIHFTLWIRGYVEPRLAELWAEQHPDRPLNLQFDFTDQSLVYLPRAA